MANRIKVAVAVLRPPPDDERLVGLWGLGEWNAPLALGTNDTHAGGGRVEERVGGLRPDCGWPRGAGPLELQLQLPFRVAKALELIELREVVGEVIKLAESGLGLRGITSSGRC